MRTVIAGVVVFGTAALLPWQSAAAQSSRWWRDGDVRRELALTAEQAATLETIFQSGLQTRRTLRRELDRLEIRVQGMIAQADVDEREAGALIEQLEQTRARRNATRTLMLYKMSRVLSPEQRQQLAELAQRRVRPR